MGEFPLAPVETYASKRPNGREKRQARLRRLRQSEFAPAGLGWSPAPALMGRCDSMTTGFTSARAARGGLQWGSGCRGADGRESALAFRLRGADKSMTIQASAPFSDRGLDAGDEHARPSTRKSAPTSRKPGGVVPAKQ